MGVEAKVVWLLAVVGVAAGQSVGQGLRQNEDVCFPGEGDLISHRPDGTLLPEIERFSYSLFDTMSSMEGERSAIMSPYSIWLVLTLAYFGALGQTQTEIQNALGFANKTQAFSTLNGLRFFLESGKGSAVLNVANRAYFSNKLNLNRCLSNEIFDLKRVNFARSEQARRAINEEVSAITQGRIPELITFLAPMTRFALVNAIFFKGSWEAEFDPKFTRPQEFLVPPGRSSGTVDMMNRMGMMLAGEAVGLDAQMVELPYKDTNISMFLLLPNKPQKPTTDLTARLNPISFGTAVRGLQNVSVNLSVPRFKLTTRFEEELKTGLAAKGITTLFDPSRANLQGFSTDETLFVDTAIHQATVEVNEEGTVAAAATAFINTRFGPSTKSLVLAFNRPFVFLIVEKGTRLPLFMGKVTSARDLEKL